MDINFKVMLFSAFVVFNQISDVFGQGFGQQFSPFGQQAFGGNVFVPQNFPRPLDQTIDLERQGSFSISSPDTAQGVQLLETRVTDGNRLLFQDGASQQGGQERQTNNFQGQNFVSGFATNLQGGQGFQTNVQPSQQGFPQNIQGGQVALAQNIQGGQPFATQGLAGFQNQIRFVANPGTGGNPFPGIQLPTARILPAPQGFTNPNPFLGPPATATAGLVNTVIGGFGGNFQGVLPTAVPNTQVNTGQQFQTGGNIQGNQFQGLPGTQQFPGTQGQLPTGMPATQDNAVNAITGSDTFNQRFSLLDPTTNAAVPDMQNSNIQNQQNQGFQANQNFQQPQQNAIFGQPQTRPNPMQFQNQGPFAGNVQPQQQTNQFTGGFQNTQFGGRFGPPPPQFIGNQGFNPVRRSEFESANDIQTSSNSGFQQQSNNFNATIFHPMDPSIGIFLPDVLLSNVGQRANTRFTQFGTIGFSDIFEHKPRPSPIPDLMSNLGPGFTTMSPPQTTTEGYSCQHK